MEQAREGRFIPLGAAGEKATPDEYFADEHDYFRGKTRDEYFSVQDIGLRKNLIEALRKNESHITQTFADDILAANSEVATAKKKMMVEPWTTAAIVAIATVGVGFVAFSLPGAIAGAVGGFFFGRGVIANAKAEANNLLEQATERLEEAKKEQALHSLWPECFTLNEEITGEREEHLDHESAYANVLTSNMRG